MLAFAFGVGVLPGDIVLQGAGLIEKAERPLLGSQRGHEFGLLEFLYSFLHFVSCALEEFLDLWVLHFGQCFCKLLGVGLLGGEYGFDVGGHGFLFAPGVLFTDEPPVGVDDLFLYLDEFIRLPLLLLAFAGWGRLGFTKDFVKRSDFGEEHV